MRTRLAGALHGNNGYRTVYRGTDVGELIHSSTFSAVVFNHCVGRFPSAEETKVIDAILIAGLDHTFLSAWPARIVISRSPESFQGAVAAGLLSIGTRRGAAASGVARILQGAVKEWGADGDADAIAEALVARSRAAHERMPGIGNPLHKVTDPRAEGILEVAAEQGVAGIHVEVMRKVAALTSEATGRPLVINYSGSVGATVSDMGWDWRIADGLVLLARTGGLIANIFEEMTNPTYESFFSELAEHGDDLYEGDR